MKPLVALVLLLAPSLQLNAALVFDSDRWPGPDRAPDLTNADTTSDRADSLNNQGSQLYTAGDYLNSRKLLQEALRLREQQPDSNPAGLASTLFNLAAVARAESRLPEAEEFYKRSLAVRRSSGPDAPAQGPALAGLALVYAATGRPVQALEFAERAVDATSPSNPRQLAIVTNTLATLLMTNGSNARAEALEAHIVDELKRIGATNSPDYVSALTNLGTSRLRQSNYGQAEFDFHEAETAAIAVVGPNHPLTATVWNNLGKVRMAQHNWTAAETLFNRAIAAWRSSLGPTSPDVAYGLTNLAALEQARKHYSQSARFYRQALEIDQASLGADSLRVANDWNNLGALSVTRGHLMEAQTELEKGLAIAEKKVGRDHPDTALIAVNLAAVYHSQQKYAEAATLLARAIPVKERVLAPDSRELESIHRLFASSLDATRITVRKASTAGL